MSAKENIFISYRRDDAAAYAGRLSDHLTALIGPQRVFMDVEDIQPGQQFAEAIDQTLALCTTVLVVIGPRWQEILESRAARKEEDYVVREIAAALDKKKKLVPVFVGNASVRALSGLPPVLADLSFRQAVELRDSTFTEDCSRLATALGLTRAHAGVLKKPAFWLAAAALLAGLLVVAAETGVGPWRGAYERQTRLAELLKTARSQAGQSEHEAAFRTYQQIVDLEPNNRAALDGQVDATMRWLEHFSVLVGEGQKAEDIAAPLLAQFKTVLEAGFARTDGKDARAADILAHIGWAHWMNEKIAFKEFGNAERYFEQALALDPTNVFAHAFLGNWLMQTNGGGARALAHFQSALAANKQRDVVRRMQLGGLLYNDSPGMRAALVRALNEMRVNNEPLAEEFGDRLSYIYNPTVSNSVELHEVLAAVPADDGWKTFEWLGSGRTGDEYAKAQRDFVHASLAEIAGDRAASLTEFRALAGQLKARHLDGRIADYTAAAVTRLSR